MFSSLSAAAAGESTPTIEQLYRAILGPETKIDLAEINRLIEALPVAELMKPGSHPDYPASLKLEFYSSKPVTSVLIALLSLSIPSVWTGWSYAPARMKTIIESLLNKAPSIVIIDNNSSHGSTSAIRYFMSYQRKINNTIITDNRAMLPIVADLLIMLLIKEADQAFKSIDDNRDSKCLFNVLNSTASFCSYMSETDFLSTLLKIIEISPRETLLKEDSSAIESGLPLSRFMCELTNEKFRNAQTGKIAKDIVKSIARKAPETITSSALTLSTKYFGEDFGNTLKNIKADWFFQ